MKEKMKWMKIWGKYCFIERCYGMITNHILLLYRVVEGVLGNLKGMAQEMGGELDRQNKQIDRLDKKAQVHDVHLKQANQRIRRQL